MLKAALAALLLSPLGAQDSDLSNLSLNELMSLEVQLGGRRAQEYFETPTATFILTQSDIKSSGLNSLPEILRLVPGLNVARVDANKWTLSIRGSDSRYANKLLVLIDGRTVYTPLFSGVYWDFHEILIEEIEQIEVVRGPGGSLWGTNAVNGIINIVTRSAEKSHGTAVTLSAGDEDLKALASLRYGWQSGQSHFRFFAQARDMDSGSGNRQAGWTQNQNHDGWTQFLVGIRGDGSRAGEKQWRWEAAATQARLDQVRLVRLMPDRLETSSAHAWFHFQAPSRWADTYQVQITTDYTDRVDGTFNEQRTSLDLDTQWDRSQGPNIWVWGVQANASHDDVVGVDRVFLVPQSETLGRGSLFGQWERHLNSNLNVILGSKMEWNSETGWEVQPRLQMSYFGWKDSMVWASIARAARTPSRFEQDVWLRFPSGSIQTGNPDLNSEYALSHDIGFRRENWAGGSLDIALYYLTYQDVVKGLRNEGSGNGYGGEISYQVRWGNQVHWLCNYAYMQMHETYPSGPAILLGTAPKHHLNSQFKWQKSQWTVAVNAYWQSRRDFSNRNHLNAFDRWDCLVNYKITSHWALQLTGQNLNDDSHLEGFDGTRLTSGVERAFIASLRYQAR